MDRELVLLVLAALLIGFAVPVGATLTSTAKPPSHSAGRVFERSAMLRLLAPLAPSALALAVLLGWALVEPENAERVPQIALLLTTPVLLVWCRAALRGLKALGPSDIGTAATVGLIAPRVILSPAFAAALDDRALAAVHAHERTHVRHRDPLRVWLANSPLPGALGG